MCDTLVALPPSTAHGATLFAKNSDRERNEAQFLELAPAAQHEAGAVLQATYLTLPQAPSTHACLLSRPFWMWGAEMGANEHGVAIGNEAVFSNVPAPRRRALTGMDLVRLGLERAVDATSAVEVMIALLEEHGQGGDCGHLSRFYYHNSFIVADARRAYVLETVDRWWVVKEVHDTCAISNALHLGEDADRVDPNLAAHAKAAGWSDAAGRFDFAGRLIDVARDGVSFGRGRQARARALLARERGAQTAASMMAVLRDHDADAEGDPDWRPEEARERSLCMHAGPGARRSQTVGSMVSELAEGAAVHWVTGGSAPCLGLFKPVVIGTGLPDQGPRPTGRFDPATRWWGHERLHRAVLEAYPAGAAAISDERDALERSFRERMDRALGGGADGQALRAVVDDCWREADAAETRWLAAMARTPRPPAPDSPYRRSWRRLDQAAGRPREWVEAATESCLSGAGVRSDAERLGR